MLELSFVLDAREEMENRLVGLGKQRINSIEPSVLGILRHLEDLDVVDAGGRGHLATVLPDTVEILTYPFQRKHGVLDVGKHHVALDRADEVVRAQRDLAG